MQPRYPSEIDCAEREQLVSYMNCGLDRILKQNVLDFQAWFVYESRANTVIGHTKFEARIDNSDLVDNGFAKL